MTGPQKHFLQQCAQAWRRMDGDQMVFIAIMTACKAQARKLRNELASYHRSMEGKKIENSLDHAQYVSTTALRADQFQLLAEKIEEWFQSEDADPSPFSLSNWGMLAELTPLMYV